MHKRIKIEYLQLWKKIEAELQILFIKTTKESKNTYNQTQNIYKYDNYEERVETWLQNGKYTSDITHGRNSQIGLDYSRRNHRGGRSLIHTRSFSWFELELPHYSNPNRE